MSVTLNSIDLEHMESEVLGRDASKQFVIAVCISSLYGLISILGSLASNDQCRTIGGMSEVAFSAMVGSYMVEMPLYLLRKYLADLNSDNLTEGEHFLYKSSRFLLKIEAVTFLKIWVGSEVFSKPYPEMLGCVMLGVPFLLLATLACGGLSMLMNA